MLQHAMRRSAVTVARPCVRAQGYCQVGVSEILLPPRQHLERGKTESTGGEEVVEVGERWW